MQRVEVGGPTGSPEPSWTGISGRAECAPDRCRQICRVKAEGPGLGLVEHMSSRRDQIEAVGPPRVRSLHPVVKAVDESWKLDPELANAGSRNRGTFGLISRATKEYFVPNVGLHLPHIGRVGLKDIDRVKRNLILILFGELVQGGNLPPKGRSGIAAEHQNDRLGAP
jgi:hypothetical protein